MYILKIFVDRSEKLSYLKNKNSLLDEELKKSKSR